MIQTIITTDYGDIVVPDAIASRLGRIARTKGRADRRYKTAARDERFMRLVMTRARSRWQSGE